MRGYSLLLVVCLKKLVISDYISVNFVERIFDNPALYSGVENLFGIYGYALQIYLRFFQVIAIWQSVLPYYSVFVFR